MINRIVAGLLAAFTMVCLAASVDANQATQAELESIQGIGPSIAAVILDERRKGAFKDWPDMINRVKGVGEGNAAKFSAQGLTINGAAYRGAKPATQEPTRK
ncbi:MAG: ComEA family DNA-binding protein [Burkholderiales bacterium]